MTEGTVEEKVSAFKSILNALIELQNNAQLSADGYTWPAVWKACENLLDVNRDIAWINRVFDLTVRDGLVNELLFNNIRRFLPKRYLQKKLDTNMDVHKLTVRQLPSSWTCNVTLGKGFKENSQEKRSRNNPINPNQS